MVSTKKSIYQRRITLMDIVALLEVLVKEIIAAEEKFLKNPKDFYSLEPRSRLPQKNFYCRFSKCCSFQHE